MKVVLTKEELGKLLRLTKKAETTPVIAMSIRDGMEGRDWATQAWDKVRAEWHELGRKYGFDPTQVRGIDRDTGEVML